MGFVDRERERIADSLREPQPPERYCQLYAAQQALAWASDPEGFRPPLETINDPAAMQPLTWGGSPADSADCSAHSRPLPS